MRLKPVDKNSLESVIKQCIEDSSIISVIAYSENLGRTP